MAVNLSPLGGAAAQFFNNDGVPLAGGLIYTYLAGTSTPEATYTTSAGTIAHSNPIVLDSAGRVPGGEIWLTEGIAYKFILRDSAGALLGTYDNITGINNSAFTRIANFTGTGSQIAFVLPISLSSENLINIFINGVYQFKNTFSLSGATITFSEAPPFTSKIEVEY
jgi:hypothetical protein